MTWGRLIGAFVVSVGVYGDAGGQEPEAAASRVTMRGLHFVANEGQWGDAGVRYGFRSRGLDIAFRDSSFTMHMRRGGDAGSPAEQSHADATPDATVDFLSDSSASIGAERAQTEHLTLTVTFPGSNRILPRGGDESAARFNYFIGDDQSTWRSDVVSFESVVYDNLYDGIDLHVLGSDGGVLKYEFHVAPGADHSRIRIAYEGAESLSIGERGDLLIQTTFGTLADGAPVAWQMIGGERVDVASRFEIMDAHTYGFAFDKQIDPAHELVIDPDVEWMTYAGGSSLDYASDIDIDDDGNLFIVGQTWSHDFEQRNNSHHGDDSDYDMFLAGLNPTGAVVWMTYLGGSSHDFANAVAAENDGGIWVVGESRSTDFAGRSNKHHGADADAVVVYVSSAGVLTWMSYLGGTGSEQAEGVVALEGGAVVSGSTGSVDFEHRTNARFGGEDAFVVELNAEGNVQWMRYYGGVQSDRAYDIATDSDGNVLVCGSTRSTDFVARTNSYYGSSNNGDAFVFKAAPTGAIQWMTYLGGTGAERANSVAATTENDVIVAGTTGSKEFTGRGNTYHGGDDDGFVASVNPLGELQWAMYLGGSRDDYAHAMRVSDAGNVIVTGETDSEDFEGRTNERNSSNNYDAFVLQILPGPTLDFMTYLGGFESDAGRAVVLDGDSNAIVAGLTNSDDFFGHTNTFRGVQDAFIVKYRLSDSTGVPPESFTRLRGLPISGGLEDLFSDDDSWLITRPDVFRAAAVPPVQVLVTGISPIQQPAALRVIVESHASVANILQRILVYNYATESYESVDVRVLATTDLTVEVLLSENPARFIDDDTGEMRILTQYNAAAFSIAPIWQARQDRIGWMVLH